MDKSSIRWGSQAAIEEVMTSIRELLFIPVFFSLHGGPVLPLVRGPAPRGTLGRHPGVGPLRRGPRRDHREPHRRRPPPACRRNGLDDDEDAADLLSRFMAAMDEEDGSELGTMFPTLKAKRRFLRGKAAGQRGSGRRRQG